MLGKAAFLHCEGRQAREVLCSQPQGREVSTPMVKAMPVPSGLMYPVLSSHRTLVKSTLSYRVITAAPSRDTLPSKRAWADGSMRISERRAVARRSCLCPAARAEK